MADEKTEMIVHDGAKAAELAQPAGPVTARNAPAIVKAAGRSAEFAWDEFFQAEIANAHTRKNYMHAVRKFLAWAEGRGLELRRVSPGDVGEYLQGLELAVPTKKLHLAALRRFFEVDRHHVAVAALKALADEGAVEAAVVASAIERYGQPGPEGSLTKWMWSDTNQELVQLAADVLGPEALTQGSRWGYELLRARGNSIEGGTTEILKNIVAERVLGLPRAGR